MFRFILIITFICAIQVPSFADVRTITTRSPVYNNIHNRHFQPNHRYYSPIRKHYTPQRYNNFSRRYNTNRSMFSDLNALEKYALNRNFSRDSELQRLQRLEMQAFGAIQSGDLNNRYNNVRNSILSRPKDNYKTSLLRNIGSYFSGRMTGFSPSFDSDPFFSSSGFAPNHYPSTYGNGSVLEYGGPFSGGQIINNYGTGSTTGVKILD